MRFLSRTAAALLALVLSACGGGGGDPDAAIDNPPPILLDPAVKFRSVPTTGSTYVAYSPGIMLNALNYASFYFIAQIPIHRDFNGNLEQQISYIFGMTKSFQLFSGSS